MDRVVLTIPRAREFGAVADLVLAGLGSRLDLTIDVIDDLQLALESLVHRDDGEEDVTVQIAVVGDAIEASVGPFRREAIEAELAGRARDGIGLRRVLDTTVDEVGLSEREGAAWVELRKEVAR